MKRIVMLCLILAFTVPALAADPPACPTVDQAAVGYWVTPISTVQRKDGAYKVTWDPMPGPMIEWGYVIFRRSEAGWWMPVGAALKSYYIDRDAQPWQDPPEYRVFAVTTAR